MRTYLLSYGLVFKMHLANIEISNLSKCIIRMHNSIHFVSVHTETYHINKDKLKSQTVSKYIKTFIKCHHHSTVNESATKNCYTGHVWWKVYRGICIDLVSICVHIFKLVWQGAVPDIANARSRTVYEGRDTF